VKGLPVTPAEPSETRLLTQLKARLGWRPVLDATLPAVAFLVGFGFAASSGRGAMVGAVAALAVAVVIAVLRLVRHEGLRPVCGAFAFVLVAAVLVRQTGQAADFFLPELVLNGALAAWFAGSLLGRRPATRTVLRLLGVRPHGGTPGYLRGQRANTAVWLAFWCAHLAMEVPLYLAHEVFWLGITRIVCGPLLWLPVAWLGWRATRRAARDPASPSGPATSG
jgi:hypothetical protein